jgi:hypothetical protein
MYICTYVDSTSYPTRYDWVHSFSTGGTAVGRCVFYEKGASLPSYVFDCHFKEANIVIEEFEELTQVLIYNNPPTVLLTETQFQILISTRSGICSAVE